MAQSNSNTSVDKIRGQMNAVFEASQYDPHTPVVNAVRWCALCNEVLDGTTLKYGGLIPIVKRGFRFAAAICRGCTDAFNKSSGRDRADLYNRIEQNLLTSLSERAFSDLFTSIDSPLEKRFIECILGNYPACVNPAWAEEMVRVAIQVARRLPELTADQITQEYSRDPERPLTGNLRAMSGVVRKLQAMRIIEATDRFENSIRITKHSCPSRVYRSLVYRG